MYGHVKNFGCGKIWWGIDFLLWDIDIFRRMRIFWTCDFGHENFLDMEKCFVMGGHGIFFGHVIFFVGMGNDELNFCVAEPQESRQSPNVEKCMRSIVS